MSIRRVGSAWLADTARVAGRVTLGEGVSVWYGAAIRGDVAPVTVGAGTNVQDNVTIHCDAGVPNLIGAGVSIGHNAVVHGAAVGDGTLIGMNATVLGRSVIGRGCLIAAGAVVPPGLEVPDGMVVMGVPGRVVRPVTEEERRYLAHLPGHYQRLACSHAETADAPEHRAYGGA